MSKTISQLKRLSVMIAWVMWRPHRKYSLRVMSRLYGKFSVGFVSKSSYFTFWRVHLKSIHFALRQDHMENIHFMLGDLRGEYELSRHYNKYRYLLSRGWRRSCLDSYPEIKESLKSNVSVYLELPKSYNICIIILLL